MHWVDYIIRRLGWAVIIIFTVSVITFFIARVIPSNPAAAWVGPHPTPELIAKARHDLMLDKPLYIQYLHYLDGWFHGNLGTSVRSHNPILLDMETYLPATLELVIVSIILAMVVGIPLGVLSGSKKGKLIDHLTRVVSIAGVSIPTFWLGLLLQLLFFRRLGILPISGRISNLIAIYNPIQHITGLYLIDSLVTFNWPAFSDVLLHLVLPAFTLAVYPLGLSIRMTRSIIIEVLNERYIMAARVAGAPERTVLYVLALKNAIVPTLNVLGLSFAYSLTGAIMVEVIFSWPGLGSYVTDAILGLDFPVIVSVTLIITVFYVLINLILDLLQALIDPRVVLT